MPINIVKPLPNLIELATEIKRHNCVTVKIPATEIITYCKSAKCAGKNAPEVYDM